MPVTVGLEGEASRQRGEKKKKKLNYLLEQVNVVSLTAIEKYILNQKFKILD